jgi:hypothetical protein
MFRIRLSKTIGDSERDHVSLLETTACPRSIHPTFLLVGNSWDRHPDKCVENGIGVKKIEGVE